MPANEGNDGDCFDSDTNKSSILFFPKSCQNCPILLSTIFTSNGEYSQAGLDSYSNCSNTVNTTNGFKKYSGESCNKNEDCYSGICNSSICGGQAISSKCDDSTSQYCDSGLACLKGTCQEVKQEGEFCKNESECSNTTYCWNNKCIAYQSLKNGEFLGGDQQQVEVKCASLLVDNKGNCLDDKNSITIETCSASKKCASDSKFSCNFFAADKLNSNQGGLTQAIQTQITALLKAIFSQNEHCPSSLKLSPQCHLITPLIQQLQEIQYLYSNIGKLVNMPSCLHSQLKYKSLYDLFIKESKILEGLQKDDNLEESSNSGESKMSILLCIFAVLVGGALVGSYLYFKNKKFRKLDDSQSSSEPSETPNGKRSGAGSKKEKLGINVSSQNKESLNLEYNPTSAKGDHQMDISNLQGVQDPKKSGHLETSVNQNFFSIDGDDDKDGKIVDSLDDNQSESDSGVSYENVFNIEGENVDKPNSSRKRRRQTNRKKIVKKDSEKKYEVVEE